jgi:hypothetical protein
MTKEMFDAYVDSLEVVDTTMEKIHGEFERTFELLLDSLTPVHGCTDRYVIYSERENLVVVASMDPHKANGAFTLVKVTTESFKTFSSWKMPGIVVTALRGYLTGFIKDIQKRTHADI